MLLEEEKNVEIEFLSIHTFFNHPIMFSAPSAAVLHHVMRKQNPAHDFFSSFSFPPGGMNVGALSKADTLPP